jgi:hypothetical protein
VNLDLIQELYELNKAFERANQGLKRMEKAGSNLSAVVRQWRAEVVNIKVETNRDVVDGLETAVTSDEEWAAKSLRECKEREGDREDVYLQVLDHETAREGERLPPRITILPNWDSGDEERYDEAQARKRQQSADKANRKALNKPRPAAGLHTAKRALEKKEWNMKRSASDKCRSPGERGRAAVYTALRGKVLESIEQQFEEGRLYLHVCFRDKREVNFTLSSRLVIEAAVLTDVSTGSSKPIKEYVPNEE